MVHLQSSKRQSGRPFNRQSKTMKKGRESKSHLQVPPLLSWLQAWTYLQVEINSDFLISRLQNVFSELSWFIFPYRVSSRHPSRLWEQSHLQSILPQEQPSSRPAPISYSSHSKHKLVYQRLLWSTAGKQILAEMVEYKPKKLVQSSHCWGVLQRHSRVHNSMWHQNLWASRIFLHTCIQVNYKP